MKPTTRIKPSFLSLLAFLAAVSICLPCKSSAQGQPVSPDCFVPFTFVSAGNTASFDNRFLGCVTWTIQYANTGFSGLTLTFQSATGAVTAGSFGTYTGTVSTGANPMTNTTGQISTFANGTVTIPWVRVLLGGLTGSGQVSGVLYGYKTGNSGSGGGGGGSGCAGTVGTPCVTGAQNSSATAVTDFVCDNSAAITISGSGLTQIVPLTSGKQIRICHYDFAASAASDLTLEYGTGSNCGTGTTALSGTYKGVISVAEDFGGRAAVVAPASNAVCLNFVTSVTAGGIVTYAIF